MNTNEKIPNDAIRGPSGKPIMVDSVSGATVCAWAQEYLGVTLDVPPADMERDDDATHLVLAGSHKRPLTTTELAVIEAFAWHGKTYSEGLRRGVPVVFPRIIHSIAYKYVGDEEKFTFSDEARACMFAGVIRVCF